MPIEKTIMLYTYEELSDKAKERARQWWLDARDETDYETVIEDFVQITELLGIRLNTHKVTLVSGKTRDDPCIWYRLAYSQGDYAAFEGVYSYTGDPVEAITEYAPKDAKLLAIATALRDAQSNYGNVLTADITYSDYYGFAIEPDFRDDVEGYEDRELFLEHYNAIKQAIRQLASWLYDALQTQDEWLSAEEQIADAMEANAYTFREDGTRED